MENCVYLGVRLGDVPFSRVCLKLVNMQSSLTDSMTENSYSLGENEKFVFIHRGRTLELNTSLQDQGVRSGSTIQVVRKSTSPAVVDNPVVPTLSDDELRQITSVFKRFTASRLWELSHPRVLSRILKLFPAIRDDLGAVAFLRDPILLSCMKSVDNFKEIAKQYPIFLQVAPTIAEILNKIDNTKLVRVPEFDSESSSSSSSSEDLTAAGSSGSLNNNNNNNNNNNVSGPSRPITQRQLADALAFAGAAFRNAQSSTGGGSSREAVVDMVTDANDPEPMATGSSDANETEPRESSGPVPAVNLRAQYAQELVQMSEMGLIDEDVNLQALQLCNGDIEAAINLVFSSSN